MKDESISFERVLYRTDIMIWSIRFVFKYIGRVFSIIVSSNWFKEMDHRHDIQESGNGKLDWWKSVGTRKRDSAYPYFKLNIKKKLKFINSSLDDVIGKTWIVVSKANLWIPIMNLVTDLTYLFRRYIVINVRLIRMNSLTWKFSDLKIWFRVYRQECFSSNQSKRFFL